MGLGSRRHDAALARRLLARLNQHLADVLRQRFEFRFANGIGENGGSEVQPFGARFQDLAEIVGHRTLIREDQTVERTPCQRFINFGRGHANGNAADRAHHQIHGAAGGTDLQPFQILRGLDLATGGKLDLIGGQRDGHERPQLVGSELLGLQNPAIVRDLVERKRPLTFGIENARQLGNRRQRIFFR